MARPFAPLPPDVARCNGFTCPSDREQCRRFTERNLAQTESPWTHGEFVDVLHGRGVSTRQCVLQVAVKPLEPLGQSVESVNPAGGINASR